MFEIELSELYKAMPSNSEPLGHRSHFINMPATLTIDPHDKKINNNHVHVIGNQSAEFEIK